MVSSSATRTRQGKRSRLPRKLQAASININSVAWKGRESYTPEFGLWSSLRSLSPSPIPTAGYVSDGQVARGGATGLEKTKGARENDREPERGKREGYRSGGRKEGKDGRYYLPPDAERSYLFGLSSTSFRATNYALPTRGVKVLVSGGGKKKKESRFSSSLSISRRFVIRQLGEAACRVTVSIYLTSNGGASLVIADRGAESIGRN